MDMFATTQPEKRHEFKVSRMGMSFRELALRQIGNAVPVELARVVASSVAVALHEDTARKEMNEELSLLSEVEHEAA